MNDPVASYPAVQLFALFFSDSAGTVSMLKKPTSLSVLSFDLL